jgi:hypothetical protein
MGFPPWKYQTSDTTNVSGRWRAILQRRFEHDAVLGGVVDALKSGSKSWPTAHTPDLR